MISLDNGVTWRLGGAVPDIGVSLLGTSLTTLAALVRRARAQIIQVRKSQAVGQLLATRFDYSHALRSP